MILQGIAVVQVAKLTIDLDFKTQAKASLVAVTISGALGLFFAYNGYGVWALVIQSLFNSLINTLLLFSILNGNLPLNSLGFPLNPCSHLVLNYYFQDFYILYI